MRRRPVVNCPRAANDREIEYDLSQDSFGSAVLCVATAALWARSYWYGDGSVYVSPSYRSFGVDSWRGRLMWSQTHFDVGPTGWWRYQRKVMGAESGYPMFQRTWANRWGFLYLSQNYIPARMGYFKPPLVRPPPPMAHAHYVGVPHWLFVILFALLPAVWIRRRCRAVPAGCCSNCGYDLRATPERCPECGTAAASAAR